MKKSLHSFLKDKKIIAAFVLAIVVVSVGAYLPNHFDKKVSGATTGLPGATDNVVGGTLGNVGGTAGASGTASPLCGFAWGATSESPSPKMGIGWVSFSSKDCDADDNGSISNAEALAKPGCPAGVTGKYGVTVQTDKTLTGYAWSSNLGWIKFGGLSGAPNTAGNNGGNAVIQGSGSLHGWARACAGTQTGTCSTMTARNDGWDGWISLRGSGYGVSFDSTLQKFSGYSWGGPVVGWLKWDQTTGAASGKGVRYCTALAPNLNNPPVISLNGDNPLVLTVGDSFNDPGAFATDTEDGDLTSSIVRTGSVNTNSVGSYTRTYTVTDSGGLSAQTNRTVVVDPPTASNLNVACSVTSPAILNRAVTWTATINPPGVSPYVYSFRFTDGGSVDTVVYPQTGATSDLVHSISKTYSTLGPKSLTVTVTDSSTPGATVSACTRQINVITNPIIIEQ